MTALVERPVVSLFHDFHNRPPGHTAANEPAAPPVLERLLETVRRFVPGSVVSLVQRTSKGQTTVLLSLGDLVDWQEKVHVLVRETERSIDEYGIGGSSGLTSGADGLPQVLGGLVVTEASGDFFLLVVRPPTEIFGNDDRHALSMFLPLARDVLELHETSVSASARCRMLTEVLDAAPAAAVVVDEEGAIVHTNRRGHDLTGPLTALPNYQSCTAAAADAPGTAEIVLVDIPGAAGPLSAHVVSIGGGRQRAVYFGEPACMSALSPEIMQTVYGLTPTEAAVAQLLCEGVSLHVIGDRLGIRYETVRTHLKRIYQKTGTERQAELVVLLLTGPAQRML